MVRIEVSYETYIVFASIFKAGRGARFAFTYEDFHKAMCEVGFQLIAPGDLVPKEAVGTKWFVSARISGRMKHATKVSERTQNMWKRQLSCFYDWDANTFLRYN